MFSKWLKKALATSQDREKIRKQIEDVKRRDVEARAGTKLQRVVVTHTNLARSDVDSTFDKIKDRGFNMDAYNTIRNWTPDKTWGLMLWGSLGTGKTQLMKALMIFWAQKGYTGLFLSLSQMMNDFRSHLDHIEDYKNRLMNSDILVIDDFGVEKTTEFVQVELLSFIDKRLARDKSLFMTTNLSKEELKNVYDKRILDRLQAMMHWVKCDGESYRREISKQISHEANKWKDKES